MELSLIFGPIRPCDRSSRLDNNGNGLRSTEGEPIKDNGRFNYFYIIFVSECTAVDNLTLGARKFHVDTLWRYARYMNLTYYILDNIIVGALLWGMTRGIMMKLLTDSYALYAFSLCYNVD